jgi:hypothetical protein
MFFALLFCSLFLLLPVSYAQIETSNSPLPSRFLISPTLETVGVGSSFIVTVNLTNAPNLYSWQIVLTYNDTDVKLNSMWVPSDDVFSSSAIMNGTDPSLMNDSLADDIGYWSHFQLVCGPDTDRSEPARGLYGLEYVMMGSSLIGNNDGVNVNNGILCMANFTMLKTGQSAINVADTLNSVIIGPWGYDCVLGEWTPITSSYSFWISTDSFLQTPHGDGCAVIGVQLPSISSSLSHSLNWHKQTP